MYEWMRLIVVFFIQYVQRKCDVRFKLEFMCIFNISVALFFLQRIFLVYKSSCMLQFSFFRLRLYIYNGKFIYIEDIFASDGICRLTKAKYLLCYYIFRKMIINQKCAFF